MVPDELDTIRTTLIENGHVLTLDNENDYHESIVIKGDVIHALGSKEDMRSAAGKDAEVIDAQGSYILPGLIDSHPHAMHFAAPAMAAVDLLDANNFEDILTRIEARVGMTPKGEWIICTPVGDPHYFITRNYLSLEERRLPDRRILDKVSPMNPVFIMAWAPRTPNCVAFNSLALEILGVNSDSPDYIDEVEIEKDTDSGMPTGILRGKVNNYYCDSPFWNELSKKLPQFPDELWEIAGLAGLQAVNANGVTGLYESHVMLIPHIEGYRKLREKNLCTARVVNTVELATYAFNMDAYSEDEVWPLMDYAEANFIKSDDYMRIDGVTFGRGGPFMPGYIRMNEPYTDHNGNPTRGRTFLPRDLEKRVTQYCLDKDIRLNMVLGGHRDVDDWLQTVDEVAKGADLRSREWVMQHCYFTAPGHMQAFREHGFHVTTSASFVYGKADMVKERMGDWALKDFIAMQRYVKAGLNLGCGSDWGPDNLWKQMALIETRECAQSGHHHVEHGLGLDRLQALHGFTRNAAKVMRWQGIGELKPGYKADLAIVDQNPLQAKVEDLPNTKVLRTVLGGVGVYDNGSLHGGTLNITPPADQVLQQTMSQK